MTTVRSEQLWNELRQPLWRLLRSRLGDAATADDLLQEVFVRVVSGLDGLQDAQRVRPWIYRIARNVLIDHYRRADPLAAAAQDLVDALPDRADAEDGAADNINGEVAAWLRAMVEHLPDGYREAVRLAELEGLTQQEVAVRLGLSLTAAKSRVRRGRAQLREMLLACCDVEIDRRGNTLSWRPRGSRTSAHCSAEACDC